MIKLRYPTLILVVTVAGHFAANSFGWYNTDPVWFDNVLHFFTGIFFALLWLKFVNPKYQKATAIISFVLILAVVWELLELGFLKVFPSYAYQLSLFSPSLAEASSDVVSNGLGALVVMLLLKTEMRFLSFLLNLPWTVLGFVGAIISVPRKVVLDYQKLAIIFSVASLWWWTWRKGHKKVRAMAWGNVILLGPNIVEKDLEHELIHIDQHHKFPFIFPALYLYENFKNGDKLNKYEREAYKKAGNFYDEE